MDIYVIEGLKSPATKWLDKRSWDLKIWARFLPPTIVHIINPVTLIKFQITLIHKNRTCLLRNGRSEEIFFSKSQQL